MRAAAVASLSAIQSPDQRAPSTASLAQPKNGSSTRFPLTIVMPGQKQRISLQCQDAAYQ